MRAGGLSLLLLLLPISIVFVGPSPWRAQSNTARVAPRVPRQAGPPGLQKAGTQVATDSLLKRWNHMKWNLKWLQMASRLPDAASRPGTCFVFCVHIVTGLGGQKGVLHLCLSCMFSNLPLRPQTLAGEIYGALGRLEAGDARSFQSRRSWRWYAFGTLGKTLSLDVKADVFLKICSVKASQQFA